MDGDVVTRACSPVTGVVDVTTSATESDGTWLATAQVKISSEEPVFAGHYPGFPLFPGVCLVECIHRAAGMTVPDGSALSLAVMDSVRLLGPVVPGDTVKISLTWRRGEGSRWACAADAETERGRAASVKLQYETGGAP